MSNMVLSLTIDMMMALLLIVTIVYCRKLNKRIQVLQDSRSELAQIIREFDESTQRATDSIAEIHEATRRISDNIQHKIDRANFLADDLQTLIDKGNRVAGSVEGGTSRAAASAARSADVGRAAPRRAGGMESIITGVNVGAKTTVTDTAAAPETGRRARQRSRAEQDVLDALKNKGE
jgi:methyl-accepting chemotaxis protein